MKTPPPGEVQTASAVEPPPTLEPGFDAAPPATGAVASTGTATAPDRLQPAKVAAAEPRGAARPRPVAVRASVADARTGAAARDASKPYRPGDAGGAPGRTVAAVAPPSAGAQAQSDVSGTQAARPAAGAQILAGLLRVWNKVAIAQMSSKVLFNVWPEDLDGKSPTDNEVAKRDIRVE